MQRHYSVSHAALLTTCAAAIVAAVGCSLFRSDSNPARSSSSDSYKLEAAFDASGAGGSSMAGPTGNAGVTVGGAQDIGAARALIEAGQVPPASMITYEGLFSEHDFPTPEGSCNELLCLQPGVALYRPVNSDSLRVLIQLTMLSSISTADDFRAPLQLAIVVDRSGSMSGQMGSMSKMEAVKSALRQVIDALPSTDEVALISFNSTYTVDFDLAPLTESRYSEAHAAIDAWHAGGSTNMEAPLRRAFEILDAARNVEHMQKRVLLFTDAQPNTGNYQDEDFLSLTKRYAQEDIGLTAFGVGLDFGAELARKISELRGGNYIFLQDNTEIERALSEDLEFLMSPIAYDFALRVQPAPGLWLSRVYGFPGGNEHEFSMTASTLFLSRNKGAVAVELTGDTEQITALGGPLAYITLSYEPIATRSTVTTTVIPTVTMLHEGADGSLVSFEGMQKMVALVSMADEVRHVLDEWHSGRYSQSDRSLQDLESRLIRIADALGDASLRDEARLIATLRQNMSTSPFYAQSEGE